MKMTLQFKSLADAEGFLTATGFCLVPGSADWRNEAGDDAGCYVIEDGYYGTLKGFRVEINRVARPPEGQALNWQLSDFEWSARPA